MIHDENKVQSWTTVTFYNETTDTLWFSLQIAEKFWLRIYGYPGSKNVSAFVVNKTSTTKEKYIGAFETIQDAIKYVSKNYPGKEVK